MCDENLFLNFKKWVYDNSRISEEDKLVGICVISKLGVKRLVEKITPIKEKDMDNDDLILEMATDFKDNGGNIVTASQDGMLTVSVSAGSFTIHKYFTKKER